ncbi:MAG: Ldh family oxidoreductase [Planctomycetota bacterium]|nr:Ldh family oxidoreductase [Planctomycetota bacterium]
MNVPPEVFTRVDAGDLTPFVRNVFEKAGMISADAQTMADLLVLTDLRGVFSHGTRQVPSYVNLLKNQQVNSRPEIRIVQEGPTTAVVDGNGGLGHFPSLLAAKLATEKAKSLGLGAATTRNHNHFGSAGKYSRIPTESGCVGFATSSHIFPIDPSVHPITAVGGGSPISFAFPNGSEPAVVIDMASSFVGVNEETVKRFPSAIFKALGMGAACAGLAKFMAGVADLHQGSEEIYPASNQGALILAIDIERFIPIDVFKRDMDEFVRLSRSLKPLPGYERSDLPGNLEWEREREWLEIGIPVSPEHQASLEAVARDLGVSPPFAKRLQRVI